MSCKYQYKETENYDTLYITIAVDKYAEQNQDEIFNKVITIISKLETNNTLSPTGVEHINKFLRVARHSNLDIRKFLEK